MAAAPTPPPVNDPSVPPVQPDLEAQRLRDDLARSNQENERLRNRLANPAPVPAPVLPGAAPTKKDIEKLLWTDPLPMIQQMARVEANNIVQGELAGAHATLVESAKANARNSTKGPDGKPAPELYDRYAGEIEAMVKANAPDQFQRNAFVWINARDNVFGQHVHEISVLTRVAAPPAGNTPRQPADGPAAPSPAPMRTQTPAAKLTDDQREMAHKIAPHIGWSHEEAEERYAHGLEVTENQGTNRASAKSAWDKVITFNNRRTLGKAPAQGAK